MANAFSDDRRCLYVAFLLGKLLLMSAKNDEPAKKAAATNIIIFQDTVSNYNKQNEKTFVE